MARSTPSSSGRGGGRRGAPGGGGSPASGGADPTPVRASRDSALPSGDGKGATPARAPTIDLCNALALRKAARHLSGFYDRHLAASGLTVTQYAILNRLRQEPRTVGALAAALATDRTTMGRNVRPLERDGLIAIRADGRDARRRALSITAEGLARLGGARAGWLAAQAEFEERYGAEPARALRETLAGVVALDLSARP